MSSSASTSASVLPDNSTVNPTDTAVEANYFIEVCKEILNEPRFSDEELASSILFHSTATRFLEYEAGSTFSNKLVHL